MKDAAFQELLTSLRQVGRIRRGESRASRVATFDPTDVQAVRAKLGTSQTECVAIDLASHRSDMQLTTTLQWLKPKTRESSDL